MVRSIPKGGEGSKNGGNVVKEDIDVGGGFNGETVPADAATAAAKVGERFAGVISRYRRAA